MKGWLTTKRKESNRQYREGQREVEKIKEIKGRTGVEVQKKTRRNDGNDSRKGKGDSKEGEAPT